MEAFLLWFFPWCFIWVDFVTSQDFVKFWGNFFFAFVLLEMIGISQGFKNFWDYLKVLLENILNHLLCSWRPLLRKESIIKILLSNLYSNLCKFACKGVNPKGIKFSEDFLSRKTKFERYFQTLFYKELFLTFKGFIFKSQIALCKQNLWPQIHNSIKNLVLILKTCFPTDLKPCSDSCKISESGFNWFGAFLQNLWKN
jgi:hypothetical protein